MTLKSYYADATIVTAYQPTADLAQLGNQAQEANARLNIFGGLAADKMGARFKMIANKRLDAAFAKAADRYGFDFRQIRDLSRGCLLVDSVEQIEEARRLLHPALRSSFLKDRSRFGYEVIEFEDLFSRPPETGFRAINMKIKVPLPKGRWHVGEIQIRHKGMEKVYKETRELRYIEQEIRKTYGDLPMPDEVKADLASLKAQRKTMHDDQAHELGLDRLERNNASRRAGGINFAPNAG